jgi:hypothetical protein
MLLFEDPVEDFVAKETHWAYANITSWACLDVIYFIFHFCPRVKIATRGVFINSVVL